MQDNHPTLAHGKICYIEIPAFDVQTSVDFYRSVFNWNIRTRSDGETSFDDGVGEVSGTWRTDRKPATEVTMLVYLMVNDIEESIRKVVHSGGRITQPIGADFPELTARFADPAGNIFGLFQERG